MAGAFWGGGAYKIFYRMTADHTSVAHATTGATVGAPTTTDAAYILKDDTANDIIVASSDFAFDATGVGSFKFSTSDQSPAFLAFLDIAAPLKAGTSSGGRAETFSEAGAKVGGAGSSSDIPYLCISRGADDGTNILTEAAIGTISRTSLSTKFERDALVTVTLEFTTVACKAASGFAIPQACFDATIWGTISAGDRTIGKDYYAIRKNLDKA